jgi:hypothetical protein
MPARTHAHAQMRTHACVGKPRMHARMHPRVRTTARKAAAWRRMRHVLIMLSKVMGDFISDRLMYRTALRMITWTGGRFGQYEHGGVSYVDVPGGRAEQSRR